MLRFNCRLMKSAMPGCQGLGFGKEDQVLEPQKVVQLHLFRGKEARFLFLGD
jgi:hypothetical protein